MAWILGLGAEARVLEPADLRDAVVAALELVGERHQVDGGRSTPPAGAGRAAPEDRRRRPPPRRGPGAPSASCRPSASPACWP